MVVSRVVPPKMFSVPVPGAVVLFNWIVPASRTTPPVKVFRPAKISWATVPFLTKVKAPVLF